MISKVDDLEFLTRKLKAKKSINKLIFCFIFCQCKVKKKEKERDINKLYLNECKHTVNSINKNSIYFT